MLLKKSVAEYFEKSNNNENLENSNMKMQENNVKIILKWLTKYDKCGNRLDEQIVRNFLYGAKNNVEKTKRKLRHFLYTKHQYPEFYANWNPSSMEIRDVFNRVNIAVMPKLTENGDRIWIFSLADPDPNKFDITAACKLLCILYQLVLTTEIRVSSEILIFDGNNFTTQHLLKFLTIQFKNICVLFKDAYTVRIKQIHIVNLNGIFERILYVAQSLCHEKVKNRFIVHKNTETLTNYLSVNVLPEDYGGNLITIRQIMHKWQDIINDNCDWLQHQEQIKTIKPSNDKNDKNFKNNISIDGSFKQLTID